MTRAVSADKTLRELRDCFRKWEVDLFEAVPEAKGSGMVVSYFRVGQWQSVKCSTFPNRAGNLRQCFLLLDRLRIAEQQGVSYSGLTSVTDLARAAPEVKMEEELMEAYGILGAAPDDPDELIASLFRRKATFYHPDKQAGDEKKMKRLNWAYELIMKSRGK